jgi:hypothetical protein
MRPVHLMPRYDNVRDSKFEFVSLCVRALPSLLTLSAQNLIDRKSSLDALVNISSGFSRASPCVAAKSLTRLYAEPRAVILETGTTGIRAGFAGADTPVAIYAFQSNVAAYESRCSSLLCLILISSPDTTIRWWLTRPRV